MRIRIRDFAKGIGLDAKTDAIDAKVISKYAGVVRPQPMATKSDHELKHGALVARRNQLLELINQENNRLKQGWDKDAKQSIQDVLETLKKQLRDPDSKLAKMLQIDTNNQRTIEVLDRPIVGEQDERLNSRPSKRSRHAFDAPSTRLSLARWCPHRAASKNPTSLSRTKRNFKMF